MKYVAFLDILGFKNKLKRLTQEEAVKFISDFSSTAYKVWAEENPDNIKGYIVSDSFIIYSNNVETDTLSDLIDIIRRICHREFIDNGILIRGAIAKGEFDAPEAKELSSLRKGLIVGQAYVDAYLLEDKGAKTVGILLSDEVYRDVDCINNCLNDIFSEKIEEKEYRIYRYLSLDFLREKDNMRRFVELAKESQWLPHYYNSLYLSLKRETSEKKTHEVIGNIFEILSEGESGSNWRDLDVFIKNAFAKEVISDFQTRFLKYIRVRII